MTLHIQPYKGSRDFYPADKQLQNYIFGVMRSVAQSYGYQEYDAPILEPTELFAAKGSQEIVNEQTYTFEDRGGRSVTIRTEMTPSVSRMVAAKRQELAYPLRWYSIPEMWRYERPQRGRLRQFWQLNVDIFGVSGIAAEHEIVMVADAVMQGYGATHDDYKIVLNSRKLLQAALVDHMGIAPDNVQACLRLIDKVHKMDKLEFSTAFTEASGQPKAQELLWQMLENGNNIDRLPAELKAHDSYRELKSLLMLLAKSGALNAEFDITLARGFDYYTDIVFEVFDTAPENARSLFGGGRYDGLVAAFGVEPVPTVGFGMGDVTIKDFLQTHKLLPKLASDIDIWAVLVGDDTYLQAQDVFKKLRAAGLCVAVDSSGKKIDKQLKNAYKAAATNILFVGEQELQSGQYKLKNIESGKEQILNIDEIIAAVSSDEQHY